MTWQPEAIIYPDAELFATTEIRALLVAADEADVYVSNRIPTPRRPRMVIFNRDGGSSDGLFDSPRVRCRVWDASDKAANDLARLVLALWLGLPKTTEAVATGHESGPYDVPDESGQAQKYLLLSLRTRGAVLA